MTAEDSAKELHKKFEQELKDVPMQGWNDVAVYRSAIICIDEIISLLSALNYPEAKILKNHFEKVKQHLINL